jgi:hypothetical protein
MCRTSHESFDDIGTHPAEPCRREVHESLPSDGSFGSSRPYQRRVVVLRFPPSRTCCRRTSTKVYRIRSFRRAPASNSARSTIQSGSVTRQPSLIFLTASGYKGARFHRILRVRRHLSVCVFPDHDGSLPFEYNVNIQYAFQYKLSLVLFRVLRRESFRGFPGEFTWVANWRGGRVSPRLAKG